MRHGGRSTAADAREVLRSGLNPMVNAWSAWTDMAASVAYGRTVATHRSAAELNTRARA